MQDKEKTSSVKKNRHLWHKILIYAICVLIAALVWLLVNYTIWRTENGQDAVKETETALAGSCEQQLLLSDADVAWIAHG